SGVSAYLFPSGATSATILNTQLVDGSDGWSLHYANAINKSGQITGIGELYGQQLGYLLTPYVDTTQPPSSKWLRYSLPMLVATLIFGGVKVGGGGVEVTAKGWHIPVDPWGPAWGTLPVAKRDALVGLALDELAKHIEDPGMRTAIRRSILEGVRSQ